MNKLKGTLLKKGKELLNNHADEIKEAVMDKVLSMTGGNKQLSNDTHENTASDTINALYSKENDAVEDNAAGPLAVDECQEDTMFEDNLSRLSDAVKGIDPTNPKEVMAAISTLTQVSNETIQYVAEQETKREEIRAQRDTAIAQINAVSDSIRLYLEKTFDERSAIFSKQFEVLDEVLRTGNSEMLALTLNKINALAASSPFKNLADIEQVQNALSDGNNEWDI